MYWKRWKRARTRYEHLIQLGTPKDQAWPWANTRKGYWRTADSQILKHSLTNRYLESIGFPDVLKRFEMLHERIGRILKIRTLIAAHEPPCTDPYARWCERTATQLMGSLLLDFGLRA
jgi:hypothetical protein